jgi:hypothetical protein
VVEHGLHGHVGRRGDVGDGDGVEAALAEEAPGGLLDVGAGEGLLLGPTRLVTHGREANNAASRPREVRSRTARFPTVSGR